VPGILGACPGGLAAPIGNIVIDNDLLNKLLAAAADAIVFLRFD
jgi:hypothetical protein